MKFTLTPQQLFLLVILGGLIGFIGGEFGHSIFDPIQNSRPQYQNSFSDDSLPQEDLQTKSAPYHSIGWQKKRGRHTNTSFLRQGMKRCDSQALTIYARTLLLRIYPQPHLRDIILKTRIHPCAIESKGARIRLTPDGTVEIRLDRTMHGEIKSDEDAAVIFSHEFAHIVLGHQNKSSDAISLSEELDTDSLGMKAMAGAGLNPCAYARSFLRYIGDQQKLLRPDVARRMAHAETGCYFAGKSSLVSRHAF